MSQTRKITKHFKRGDIVTFDDLTKSDGYLSRAYGENCLMEVQGYDDANWCRIIYLTPRDESDKGRENGHPDMRLRLVKPKEHLPEDLFTL